MDASAKSPMDDIKKLGEILMKRTSEKGKNKFTTENRSHVKRHRY